MSTTTSKSLHRAWAGGDYPYVMRLPGQRAVAMTIPEEWVMRDKSGEIAFRPPAVRWLDRMRALFSRPVESPSPGFIRSLREAMNLTQEQLAERLGVTKMTISRWERGAMKPGGAAIRSLLRLRASALRRGLPVDANSR